MLTRFAPSPTGFLHIGHVLAAREAFGFTNLHRGECLLRIEDIDHTRCKPEYTEAIYEDLTWLGFEWPNPPRVQSNHLSDYENVVTQLWQKGLTYHCFKSRTDLALSPPAPIPADEVLKLEGLGHTPAIRLSMEAAKDVIKGKSLTYRDNGETKTVDLNAMEDIVLSRKDIKTSYHIAVTHDDMAQGITHVVRGADFIDQTPYQVLIQHLMGWPTPIYHHHPLLRRGDGKKLSKRNQDTTIRSLREKGLTASEVLAMAQAQ